MAATEPLQRPRSKSNFSFKSDKSHKSQGSIGNKPKETAEEKRRSHLSLTGKANPNAAINEAQPIAAALEKPTLSSLRSFTHVDAYGNSIAEPDLSNPTRPRWERPLDTIKSFEAAIDTEYKRRSMIRADTAPDHSSNYQSRRSSYYGGHNERSQRPATGGYYGNGTGRDTYSEQNYGPPVAAPPRSRYNQRMMSDPMNGRYSNGQQSFPPQAYQSSRDTVNTGASGSGSEPWGHSTDPSSDNSSVERIAPAARPDGGEQYGFAGFGGAPIMEEYRQDPTYSYPNASSQAGYWPPNHPSAVAPPAVPPVPPKHGSGRKPIPLGAGSHQQLQNTSSNEQKSRTLSKTDSGDKRKSWFKRKFSKE